jgi:lipoyl-dependent peroxiredoxin
VKVGKGIVHAAHSARCFGLTPIRPGRLTMPERTASAVWNGSLTEGNGTMRMGSGAYEGPYSFQSRFEEGDGTNPEELIAAAHAGCFSMALSGELGKAGHDVDTVETDATVHIDEVDDGFAIKRIELRTRVRAPGLENDAFQEAAEAAKKGCPVSQALAAVESIELDAQLEG